MATRRTYTNADLTRKPMTVTVQRPQTQSPRTYAPTRDAELLDQILNEGTTVEEILNSARQAASRSSVADPYSRAKRETDDATAQSAAMPMPTARDAARGVLLPASFVPGPVGVGSALGHAALADSPQSGALEALLAVLPFGLGKLGRGGKAAAPVVDRWMPNVPSAGRAIGRASTARVPYARPTEYSLAESARPSSVQTLIDDAPGAIPDRKFTAFKDADRGANELEALEALTGSDIERLGTRGTAPVSSAPANAASVRRVPMGATGDEYQAIRESGGAFAPERRGARLEEWPEELWDYILSGFGR